jgi:hypothetical protein
MRCNKILCVETFKRRAVACNLVRSWNQIVRRKGESGRVQHLANVASGLWSLGVMVQKRNARHDVEKHQAAENRERSVRELCGEEPEW